MDPITNKFLTEFTKIFELNKKKKVLFLSIFVIIVVLIKKMGLLMSNLMIYQLEIIPKVLMELL